MKLRLCSFATGLIWIPIIFVGVSYAAEGLSVSSSRLLIEGGKTATALVLSNTTGSEFLTKVWIETSDGRTTEDVMAVPPVAYSPSNKHVRFQVMALQPEKFPKDKESLFYFRSHSVPATGETSNALTIAYDVRLKVFYRPEELEGDMTSAIEDLKWSFKKGVLTAFNPSNFHVSLVTYGIENRYKEIKDCVIAPGKSVSFKVKGQYPKNVLIRWAAIDDYGSPIRVSTNVENVP